MPNILFPNPFALVVDDLGWLDGGSQEAEGGPYRAGFKRRLTAEDYLPLVELGRAAGVRIQGAFVLCELDRRNAVARVPSASRDGSRWDNSANVSSEQERIMALVKAQAAHLEFGLHGVGHEFWEDGRRRRAEWYDLEGRRPWPEAEIRAHLELFRTIMAQYGWTAEAGQSFPESFSACAYSYFWNPSGPPYSLGRILREHGVRFASTDFSQIPELHPPVAEGGGVDQGVLVVDRHNFGNDWWEPACLPRMQPDAFDTDLAEAHWPNLLAVDDPFQAALTARWIRLFREIQASEDRYLAKNTEQFNSQWLYKRYCKVRETEPGRVVIDSSAVPAEVFSQGFAGELVLKVKLPEGSHVARAVLDGLPIPSLQEDAGYALLHLPPPERELAILEYELGPALPRGVILNGGTCNVYSRREEGNQLAFRVRAYGEQELDVTCPRAPVAVTCTNPGLRVALATAAPGEGLVRIRLEAQDMQGETGETRLEF